MEIGDVAAWLAIPVQIFFVDLLLGADNALLIALACRSLGPEETRKAILLGTTGAILFRLGLTVIASSLLALPLVKLAGAWILIVIALNVAEERRSDDGEGRSFPVARADLWSAATVIVVADSAMSLDNVVALAAIARGNFWLLAAGVALSIPVLAYGGLILATLLQRAPGLIKIGAALLGWIAGDMAISDPLVADWANSNAPGLVAIAPALGAAFVYLCGGRNPASPRAANCALPAPAPRSAMPNVAATPEPPRASAPLPEPQAPDGTERAPNWRQDPVAVIGALILAVVAGVALLFASYLDSLY